MATTEVVRQYLNERGHRLRTPERRKLLKLMNNGVLLALHDAAGIPLSLVVAGYTGMLLSCTANPLWSKNPWLGPLFSASAISTGAEAVSFVLDCKAKAARTASPGQTVLKKVDTLAHIAEAIAMAGFLRFAGKKAMPLRQGALRRHHRFSLGSMLASELLKLLPSWHSRQPVRLLSATLGLLAGFSMRWSMVFGGQEAAQNPHLARLASRPPHQEASHGS
jgi:formate-dependent nitrite reductase membrane component NrfD